VGKIKSIFERDNAHTAQNRSDLLTSTSAAFWVLYMRAELVRICAEKAAFFTMKTVFKLISLSEQFAS